ncbi:hypothetical protein PVK06_024488 [Gossypium arboreum]|uniref:Uncharacterized protein n=1 Tax=Gossypium arboreum TaxID=29729 RepID=A0ABR0PE88_GOSAR|nr:hypothetical protein PVK06_024488 [Gossypium arboreum]
MDFEGKQGREELPVSQKHEMVQETIVKVSPPTLGNNNPELGTEALTRSVGEVLEEVFEARVKAYGEILQARRLECSRKRDHNPLKQESSSVKRVKTRLNFSACEHCKKRHPSECWRKSGTSLRCWSKKHWVWDCTVPFKSGCAKVGDRGLRHVLINRCVFRTTLAVELKMPVHGDGSHTSVRAHVWEP